MFSKLFVVLTAVVATVNAQAPAAPQPSLDACTVQCLTNAAAMNGCTSFTDLTCVCTNTAFQSAAASCISTTCGAADLAAAVALQSVECSAAAGPSAAPVPVPASSAAGAGGPVSTEPASVAGEPSAAGGSTVAGGGGAGGPTAVGASSAAIQSGLTPSPTKGASTNGASSATGASAAAASSSAPSSAAGSLIANGGVAAIMAMVAGFLAI